MRRLSRFIWKRDRTSPLRLGLGCDETGLLNLIRQSVPPVADEVAEAAILPSFRMAADWTVADQIETASAIEMTRL